MRIVLHCTCGDALIAYTVPDRRLEVRRDFEDAHRGPGHAPCSARIARLARRRRARIQDPAQELLDLHTPRHGDSPC